MICTNTTTGQGIPTEQGGPEKAGRSVRVHSLRLLLNVVPLLLVELRGVPRTRDSAPVVQVVGRLPRREVGRAKGGPGQLHELVPLPHNSQLHEDLPQGSEPRSCHRGDQEGDGDLNGLLEAIKQNTVFFVHWDTDGSDENSLVHLG